jgi:hypothetical protein
MTWLAAVMSKPSSRGMPFAAPPEPDDGVPQEAIVHVDATLPGHRLEALRIEVHRVVDERRQQVVGRGDRVEVAGAVQVDARRRLERGPPAAGAAALRAEDGPE